MSISSDIRSYADTAVNQGKQVLDQAQTQLNDVTGQANELVGKAKENVSVLTEKATSAANDLRASAEKAINLDAIKSAVEPYLAQVKGYRATAQDKAEVLISGLKNDKRVGKLVDAAGSVSGVVVETVQERVVKPVQALANRGAKDVKAAAPKPATKPVAKPAPAKASRPAATKPASKPAARKAPAKRSTKA